MRGLLRLLLSASSAAAAALAGVDGSVKLVEAARGVRRWTGVEGDPGSILYRNYHLQRRLDKTSPTGINMCCRFWAHTSRLNSIIW